jgi:hypothetical protein
MSTSNQLQTVSEGFITEETLLKNYLPVSRGTAVNWRKSGRLPFVKIGAKILYHVPTVTSAILRLQKGGAQ